MTKSVEVEKLFEHKWDVKEKIRSHRDNIRLLLDFATGLKKLPLYDRTEEDEARLMVTLKNLHLQARKLRQDYLRVMDAIAKAKNNAK
jgi:hypothetical protein